MPYGNLGMQHLQTELARYPELFDNYGEKTSRGCGTAAGQCQLCAADVELCATYHKNKSGEAPHSTIYLMIEAYPFGLHPEVR